MDKLKAVLPHHVQVNTVAVKDAQISFKQSKLPLFQAEAKKDQFNSDQWLECFEKCQKARQ